MRPERPPFARRTTCRRRKPTTRLATYLFVRRPLLRSRRRKSDVKRVFQSRENWSFNLFTTGDLLHTRAGPLQSTSRTMILRADHGVCCRCHAACGSRTYMYASPNRRFDDIRRDDHRSMLPSLAQKMCAPSYLRICLFEKNSLPTLNHTCYVT